MIFCEKEGLLLLQILCIRLAKNNGQIMSRAQNIIQVFDENSLIMPFDLRQAYLESLLLRTICYL